jgi:mono/diheme cytochrome c family protein
MSRNLLAVIAAASIVVVSPIAVSPVALRAASAPDRTVTFASQIAPIVYSQCAGCHHPGEAAPFSLTSYEEVKKRGQLIASVTKSHYMPPWHAAPGFGEFAGERRLTELQIALIDQWVKEGMPEGDASKTAPLPHFVDGWHLGKPDLVVTMPKGFALPASGPDIYRNFVVPLNLTEDKWVRAIEFHPGTRTVVHHTLFSYDASGALRKRDGADGRPGFSGMDGGRSTNGGSLGGWAVGATPVPLAEGLAYPLPKGSDLILQEHFHLTGKAETEQSTVGIYFADKAPERRLMAIQVPPIFALGSHLDIPPAEKAYTIHDSFEVPVDVKAWGIGAHAHYLGKDMKAVATRPDGTKVPLLWIPDWDFAWQDRYPYKEPFVLPRGTRIDVTLVYDNSADNPHQPSNPPKRVWWGEGSLDEMGSITLQVTAVRKADERVLANAVRLARGKAILAAATDGTLRRMRKGPQ